MTKEEICFKLLEFYYNNKSAFNYYCMDLDDLIEKYNKIIKSVEIKEEIRIIKGDEK